MTSSETIKKWLIAAAMKIDKKASNCPICMGEWIEFQYVGNVSTRLGYLDVWCDSCHNGVHVSRAIAPNTVEMLPFDTPRDVLRERIPKINYI